MIKRHKDLRGKPQDGEKPRDQLRQIQHERRTTLSQDQPPTTEEEDEFHAFVVEDMETGSEGTESGQNSIYPKVLLPLSERKDLWKPWRRALIVKVLGK